jgi:hypothetical protein
MNGPQPYDSLRKNLDLFQGLCGQKDMSNVVVATTMWEEVQRETGLQREVELNERLEDMVAKGCRVDRFLNAQESAWSIIGCW